MYRPTQRIRFFLKRDYATKSGVWRLYIGCLEHLCFMNKCFGWFVFISYYTCIHFFSFTSFFILRSMCTCSILFVYLKECFYQILHDCIWKHADTVIFLYIQSTDIRIPKVLEAPSRLDLICSFRIPDRKPYKKDFRTLSRPKKRFINLV